MTPWVDALIVVDGAALLVGLTVLRRVTKIVKTTATAVQEATDEGIRRAQTEALQGFLSAVTPAVTALHEMLPQSLATVLGSVRVKADGQLEITNREVLDPSVENGLQLVPRKETA